MDIDKAKQLGVCRICEKPFEGIEAQPVGWMERFDAVVYPQKIILNGGVEFAHEKCLPAQPKKITVKTTPTLGHWQRKDGQYAHHGDCLFWSYMFCDCGLLNHLRYHQDLRKNYPKYDDESFYHKNRVELLKSFVLNPQESYILKEWEERIKKMANTYTEVSCSGCGQPMLEYVIEDADEGPMKISDFFNERFGPYIAMCKECDSKRKKDD